MLIGAPILAAVSVFGLVGLLQADDEQTVTFVDGLLVAGVAFVSGYLSIGLLMAVVRRMSFLPFVLYRFALGIVLILATPLVGVFSI
jgi:undecaprenyl-diphosphatase